MQNNKNWKEKLNTQFFGGIPMEDMGTNQVDEEDLQVFIAQVEKDAKEESMKYTDEPFLKSIENKAKMEVLKEILEDINRVLTIQYSGVRPDIDFEKGYTRAYENMRATVKKNLSLESEE